MSGVQSLNEAFAAMRERGIVKAVVDFYDGDGLRHKDVTLFYVTPGVTTELYNEADYLVEQGRWAVWHWDPNAAEPYFGGRGAYAWRDATEGEIWDSRLYNTLVLPLEDVRGPEASGQLVWDIEAGTVTADYTRMVPKHEIQVVRLVTEQEGS